MNFMEKGRAWLATKRRTHQSRTVTYRRGDEAVEDLVVGIGQSQIDNLNTVSVEPGRQDVLMMSATMANRDYIITAADLGELWPPKSGDLIDDGNDKAGAVYRFQVMSLPSQNPWRWLHGGYQTQARVHVKFLKEYRSLWSDDFTGTNGTSLASHGEYAIGDGSVVLSSNRAVAGAASAQAYFDPEASEVKAFANICVNLSAAALASKHAEWGLAIRCASSGSGQRDGYYCTLKIGGSTQGTRRLRIVERVAGVSTEVAVVNIPGELDLAATYRLQVEDTGNKVLTTLFDSSGEVALASVGKQSPSFAGQATCGLVFAHHADIDASLPWIDDLRVES